MADVDFSDNDAQTMTLEVECGGRTFSPELDAATPPTPRPQVRKLHERKEETELPDLLAEVVFGQLAWSKLPQEEPGRQPLVETYIQSLQQIEGFRRDVETMVRCACIANLEFRQGKGTTHNEARDKAMSAKLDEMLAQATAHWSPTKNILDAKLVAQPIPTVRDKLQSALSKASAEFARQFFELLARLVDRQLFGLIEWMPNHCCNYHFFKQVIIQENNGSTSRVVDSRYEDSGRSDSSGRIVGWNKVEDRTEGKHVHRFARHEHSVMNAVRTTIQNSRVVIPPEVVPLVERIPKWLYSLVHMIDGDIIRERIIEQDTKVETWADVHVHDEPIFGCEPAVIIGPYVLTGWGPREVGVEQARRQAVQATASQHHTKKVAIGRAPWFAAAAIVMTLLGVFLLVRLLHGSGGAVFVGLAFMAAVGAAWQSAFDFGTAQRNPKASLAAHCLAASVALQIMFVYWCVARWFQPLSWIPLVVLGLGIFICHSISRRLQ